MYLVFGTAEFKIKDFSYPGMPILVKQNNDIFIEAVEFLVYYCLKRGSVQSRRSWDTYGRDLYDFFAFLETNGLNWRDVESRTNETLLAIYRDASFEQFNLAASTVNRRLRLAIKFYQYAVGQGWVQRLPYEMETVVVLQPYGFLAHTDTSGGLRSRPDVMLKTPRTRIKVLNSEQVRELLAAIRNPTLKLIVRFALRIGLRKTELLTFPVSYIRNPSSTSMRSHVVVPLNPSEMSIKVDVARTIHVPVSVMKALWEYVIHQRHELVMGKDHPTDRLFVTARGEAWSPDSRALNTMLKDLDLPFPVYPHILRHTYATHTLKSLRQKANLSFDALLYVRDRLGHASITTTEKYLHFLHQIEDDLMTQYQQELDAICTEVA